MLDARQGMEPPFAREQPALAPHQFTEHAGHRGATRQRVVVPAVGAERVVVLLHCVPEAGGDRLLAQRQVAGALIRF